MKMNAEKYVNRIIKSLKCSGKKKAEIKQQLLSDIGVRMDSGEAWEPIMQSMGTPKEVSEEFNQNLSEDEKRAYKKKKIFRTTAIIAAVILAVLLLLALILRWMLPKFSEIGSSGIFSEEIIEEKTKNVILLLNQDDFEALRADAIGEMKPILTPEKINQARTFVSDDWGEMDSIGNVYSYEVRQRGKVYAMAQVSVSYENTNATFTLMFNEDMKLAGLYMK